MKRRIFVLTFCALLWFSVGRINGYQDKPPAPSYFIAIFSAGSSWDKAKEAHQQTGFKEHSENLKRLRTEKKIALGARYSDKGMVVIHASTEADARAMFASDLMVQSKVFTLELYPFKPFYKGCLE